jgi:hypothetical protein
MSGCIGANKTGEFGFAGVAGRLLLGIDQSSVSNTTLRTGYRQMKGAMAAMVTGGSVLSGIFAR